MRDLQARIIAELHVSPVIDPAEQVRSRIDFLKAYLRTTGAAGFVLGISGGQDSTLAGRLCQLAVTELADEGDSAQFLAVRLPYGVQRDESDAQLALDFIQPSETVDFNIERGVDGLTAEYGDATGTPLSDFGKGNVKARMRMIAQYALAGEARLLVIGTDHAAEAVTGFFTKFGDGAADVVPLTGLNKRRVRAIASHLGAPPELVFKTPTADLETEAPLKPDEDALGVSYDDIDDFLEGKDVRPTAHKRILTTYHGTAHKRTLPVAPT